MGPNIFNSLLSDYCGSGNYKAVLKLFKEKDDLDLTYGNGVCFRLVIKHSDIKILAVLLEYYNKHKLSCSRESSEYKHALFDLKKILEDAKDMFNFSKEVQMLLAPYLSLEDENLQDQDLSEADDELFDDNKESLQSSDIPNFDEWYGHIKSENIIAGGDSTILQNIDCI
jgi:hypothetical protein